MHTLHSLNEMHARAAELRSQGKIVALVPTMGALHEGHLSLVRLAKERADAVVVSIFVNPVQFGPNEDFNAYPRTLDADLALLEAEGIDVAFLPTKDALYPHGYSTYVTEETITKHLCGISRPSHFRGVTTVVAKLFNIIRPDLAVFGQKDAQQVAVIRKMVQDLHFDIDIITGPTSREADGLAMSSRNRRLSNNQRHDALALNRALQRVQEMVAQGVRSPDRLIAEATHIISEHRRVRVIYVSIVDLDTMVAVRDVEPGKCLMAIAAWIDEVRLIDNQIL